MRSANKNKTKNKIRNIIYALISFLLMVFIVSQVYFLARYTLGYEIDTNKLVIYKLINKIENKTTTQEYTK